MSPLPLWVGSHNLYRSAGRPVLVEARTTIGYCHRPLLVDSRTTIGLHPVPLLVCTTGE